MKGDMENNSDLERIKELLQKVNELATRGVGGEKEAAQRKLEKLLNKYGLTLNSLNNEKSKERTFKIKNREDYVTILSHVIWDIHPDAKINQNTRKLEVYSKLTTEQYIEVTEKFDYFWKLWCKEKEEFMMAFIINNRLGIRAGKVKAEGKVTLDSNLINSLRDKIISSSKGEYVSKNKKLIKES